MLELIPIITGVVSATANLGFAIHSWWQRQKNKEAQQSAFRTSLPTATAAKDLNSLMDVQSAYWRSNPGMWKALGNDAASKLLVGNDSQYQRLSTPPTPTQMGISKTWRRWRTPFRIAWIGKVPLTE